jgi:cobalt-zinc-cadmium resistance protein CzcA
MIRYYASAVRRLAMLDSLYSEFVRSAALRLEAGDAPATELLQARTRKGEVEQRRMQAETALRAEEENLRRMLNADRPLTAAKGEYTPMLLITPVDSASAPVHPAIALARQDAVVAEMAQRVEKAQRLPDIQIGYTNQSLIGYQIVDGQEQYFSGGDRFHAATIGLAFPLFTASKSRIRALDYERQAAEALADAHQRRLSTDLANANRAYDQLMTQYQYAQETALPNTRAIVSAAKLGYETGETSYIAYLLALETLRDIEAGALQTTRELNETVIRILSLLNQ